MIQATTSYLSAFSFSTIIGNLWQMIAVETLESTNHTLHAYYLEGDGMIEQFNRSLLQLLCNYVDNKAIYAYHTFAYSSTGVSLYMLMF